MLQLLGVESLQKERRIRITGEPPKCVYKFKKKKEMIILNVYINFNTLF
jgi:hypothetical protein